MQKLTDAELTAAWWADEWNTLWEQAVPIVRAVVDRLIWLGEVYGVEREELIAEGNLAAGAAVRSWDAIMGTFNAHVSSRVRWALLTLASSLARTNGAEIEVDEIPDENAPEPDHEAELTQLRARMAERLTHAEMRLLVLHFFGVDGGEPFTQGEIAVMHDVSQATVHRELQRVLAKLA